MKRHKLIAARKERHLSQSEIAKMIKMSQSQYQRRESGVINISEEEWVQISEVLKKDIKEIKNEEIISDIFDYDKYLDFVLSSNNSIYNFLEFIIKKLYDNEVFKRDMLDVKNEINKIKIFLSTD